MILDEMIWRTFLDDLCRRMKSDEKQAFAEAVGVSMATVNRWRRGEDWPKTRNLERLLTVLSEEQRQQFLMLAKKDPKLWALLPADARANVPEVVTSEGGHLSHFQLGLLDHFCLKLLRLQRDTPDRFWQLSGAILREALKQLETHPVQTGLEIIIAKCMPPRQDGKIHSLRMLVGMGTSPWRGDLHYRDGFFGMESLAGYAVARRHGEMIPDLFHAPAQVRGQERSAAAFPIMRENCIAGALLVSSMEAEYFTPERMGLIEIFADIVRLAFYDIEAHFCPASSIDLGLMPPWPVQAKHFEAFRRRVEDAYRKASREEDATLRELAGVEETVRIQMEDELLAIASSGESLVV